MFCVLWLAERVMASWLSCALAVVGQKFPMVLVTLFTKLSEMLPVTRDVGTSPDSNGKRGVRLMVVTQGQELHSYPPPV